MPGDVGGKVSDGRSYPDMSYPWINPKSLINIINGADNPDIIYNQ
jgi:hypothetical protein